MNAIGTRAGLMLLSGLSVLNLFIFVFRLGLMYSIGNLVCYDGLLMIVIV